MSYPSDTDTLRQMFDSDDDTEMETPTVTDPKLQSRLNAEEAKRKARIAHEASLDRRFALYQGTIDLVRNFHKIALEQRLTPPKVNSLTGKFTRDPRRALPSRAWILLLRLFPVHDTVTIHGQAVNFCRFYPQALALTKSGTILIADPMHGVTPGFLLEDPNPSHFAWHPLNRENVHFLGEPHELEEVGQAITRIAAESRTKPAQQ